MTLLKPALFLVLVIFVFNVIFAVNNDELVVGSVSSSSVVRRGGFEKEDFECKKGNGGLEENVLENEDYIYTNSLP
ncbi:hypothetical protein QN277_006415 [Acacia crassicarpa]|uniref:Glycine-rich protein n=1 Tax=Acacia crassicarpa TaxID=499986 RepID=A0AAE1ITH6_9FABA|nr:hypothetical protein QN277_006415 [Acacia crassicarpa]